MKPGLFPLVLALAAAPIAAGAQTQPPPLVAFATAYGKLSGYRTTAHVYQVQGSQSQNSVYDFDFAKPSSITVDVRSGTYAGTNVRWTGGLGVRTTCDGFTQNVDLTDAPAATLRGTTVVQLEFGAILKHAEETAGTLTTGTTTLGGASVDSVNIDVANPRGDDGLTREVLYISHSNSLPVRLDGFVGADLVQTVSFENTTTTSQ